LFFKRKVEVIVSPALTNSGAFKEVSKSFRFPEITNSKSLKTDRRVFFGSVKVILYL
jgi:hypothetical protein